MPTGWSYRDNAIKTGKQVILTGNSSLQPTGAVTLFDDFAGDTINLDLFVATSVATDGGTDWAQAVGNNGIAQCVTDNTDLDGEYLSGPLAHELEDASSGLVIFETRVLMATDVAAKGFYVGLSDATSDDHSPLHHNGGTLTAVADDAVGFIYDTDGTGTDQWRLAAVNETVVATAVNSGSVPVAGTYDTLRLEVDIAGNAAGFVNGGFVGVIADAVDLAVDLCPLINHFSNEAASQTGQADYIFYAYPRT